MEKPRVLLVDDDQDIALGARIRMEASGFEVETAYDGEEGLAAALANPPDVIVLDIRMPKMDGLTMLAALRADERTAGLRAIVLSANGIDENRTRAADLGAKLFLRKPYDPKQLVTFLEQLLRAEAA